MSVPDPVRTALRTSSVVVNPWASAARKQSSQPEIGSPSTLLLFS